MQVRSISFETWLTNHSDDHEAKWCRELYPWEIFGALDYSDNAINRPQEVESSSGRFVATIQNIFLGENGRTNILIHLGSKAESQSQQWRHRDWDDVFQLVCTPDGHFITLFTKKQDPSKDILRRFMTGGLGQVEAERSLPVSGMLFRSLISYAARDIFGLLNSAATTGSRRATGQFRVGDSKDNGALPFLSRGNELWLMYAFNEEKAHRLAIANSGKCHSLIVIYCHPTFTQHHRCNEKTARVLSLSEFLSMGSPDIRVRYIPQMRFLLNHLRSDTAVPHPVSEESLRLQILSGSKTPREIQTSELREAKAGLGRAIVTTGDAAYVLACANLLNAAMNRKLGLYKGTQRLEKEVYSFKAHLARSLEELIRNHPPSTEVYVSPEDLVLIRINGVQLSFHAIPRTPFVREYTSLPENRPQQWSGIRLQPVAPLILDWARTLLREEGQVRA